MNLLVFAQDEGLIKQICASQMFTQYEIRNSFDGLEESLISSYNIVLISDKILSFEDMHYARERFGEHVIFYLLSASRAAQQVETMGHVNDINIIYPKQTAAQVLRYIESILRPRDNTEKNRVVAFCGTQPQVGVTSLALSVASRLGTLTGTKVGVLGLNPWNPGDFFIRYSGNYLDEFSTQLANKVLNSSQLLNSMGKYNSFYYLAGNRSIKKQFKYYQEEINFLINLAKEVFDLLILDAGSHFDNAMSLEALANSDVTFLITNQQSCGYRAWTYSFEQIIEPLGYKKSDFLLILNKYHESTQLLTAKQIAQEYGLPFVRYITDLGPLGVSAEREKLLLLDYKDPAYEKDIESLAQTLIKVYALPILPTVMPEKTKGSLINKLFGVKGA